MPLTPDVVRAAAALEAATDTAIALLDTLLAEATPATVDDVRPALFGLAMAHHALQGAIVAAAEAHAAAANLVH